MSELLSYGEVQKLLKDLPKEQGELVKDIAPALITVSGIQRVLQLLLAERVSIRDLPTILEGIADGARLHAQPGIPGRARARAARAPDLRAAHLAGRLPAADRALGQMGAGVRRVDRRPGRGHAASRCSPRGSRSSSQLVRERFEQAAREGEAPVLVTSPGVRPFVRSIVERFRTQTAVLSQSEIHPRARLKTVGGI